MDRICHRKWAGWIALTLSLLGTNVFAQQGFLSVNCGGRRNISAQNGITWISDANYIAVGNTTDIADVTEQDDGFSFYSLRFFPNPLNKSCYQLPVAPNVPYLLRLSFTLGNYSGYQQWPSFAFSIETPGMLAFRNVSFTNTDVFYYEYVLVSSGSVLYICLIRTSDTDNPFINAIELRTLLEGMYAAAKPGTILALSRRRNIGGNSSVIRYRYPADNFDRFWKVPDLIRTYFVSTTHLISASNTEDFPPTDVMQTAGIINSSQTEGGDQTLYFRLETFQGKTFLVLYFAEIEMLNLSESRSFYVNINDINRSNITTLERNYSAMEQTFLSSADSTRNFTFKIVKAPNTNLGPILNAYELYSLIDTQPATSSEDVKALNAMKIKFDIKDWISDPCFLIEWKGISCDNTSVPIRISEMNLSGRNLTGSIPEDIGQLTALVNMSLDNNNLMGSLPNFSNLTMLERLYLQNNNLSGSVPEWLSELENLKELYIGNNNFSGVIPQQLFNKFLNSSLKVNYSSNPYLSEPEAQDILPNLNKNKVGVILGITLSGVLIITLAVIVGTVFYRNKFRRTEGLQMVPDYCIAVVPSPTKSRVFTLDDISAATQNFSQKIGRGGFGWVFFGQLPEGKEIAVKVLSLFSTQGVNQFLNEVNLLSRFHHKNLVSLLGYCNESRELMLIYEYMPGGCLRDHLYGDSEQFPILDWKKRLKIALDAAHGLEYLHMGCSPKIIHRDIKTTNILLDGDFNGKLADFGLSKMTMDEATHVTTTVKGTFGYLDPEYFHTQNLTEKSDVYSFGVVLFEIICGRQPINGNLPEEEVNLIRWVTPFMDIDENQNKIAEIIDKRFGENYDMKSVTRVAKLANRCVQAHPSSRPCLSEVVAELREAIKHDNDVSEDIRVDCHSDVTHLMVESIGHEGMRWSDDSANIPNVGR